MQSGSPFNLETVSGFLVDNTYLLTALELYQESLERGVIIPNLQSFFSKDEFLSLLDTKALNEAQASQPRRKRKISVNTEQDYQARIKTLEYDLRQERQNLQVLRREVQVCTILFECSVTSTGTFVHPQATHRRRVKEGREGGGWRPDKFRSEDDEQFGTPVLGGE